jgi:hypothetical protein
MRELWRVIKPNGWVVIMVPITSTLTVEDPSISDPIERQRLFGQHDHVRRYGPDISQRLEACGFNVNVIIADDLVNENDIIKMDLRNQARIFCSVK